MRRGAGRSFLPASLVVAVPFAWLGLFFLAPFAIVVAISFAEPTLAQPPFTPVIVWNDGWPRLDLHLTSYRLLVDDSLYIYAFANSVRIALVSTLICLVIGYPMALAISRAPEAARFPLLMLVVLPFWTSFLIRVYAWMGLLGLNGPINGLLVGLGAIDEPLALLHNDFAIHLGIVYSYLPFMVLPIYVALVRIDPALVEAAGDLGCRPATAFRRVILPLSMPGVIAGSMLVMIPAIGEFVIPDLLGGPDAVMIGKILWTEFFANRDWPAAAAIAVALLVLLVLPIIIFQRAEAREIGASR